MRSLGKSRLHTLVSARITQKHTCSTPFCLYKKFSLFNMLRMNFAFYTFLKLNFISAWVRSNICADNQGFKQLRIVV